MDFASDLFKRAYETHFWGIGEGGIRTRNDSSNDNDLQQSIDEKIANPPVSVPENGDSGNIQALAEQLSKLSPEDRAELVRLLQASSHDNGSEGHPFVPQRGGV